MGKTATMDRAEQAISKLTRMFESGDLPEAIAETVIRRKQSDAPSATWSLGNQLLMLLSGTTDARGFRQWDKAGRKVEKGAKALYILGPLTKKITEEDGSERVIIYGFKGVPVFRLEDTAGEEIEPVDYTPMEMPPLWDVAEKLGLSQVEYGPYVGGFLGYYHPSEDRIFLVTHDVSTFFHELAHAAHNRVEKLRGGQVARDEIIAETVAAVLSLMYGYEGHIPKSYNYIERYTKDAKDPARAIMQVLGTVQKVLDVILNEVEEEKA